MAVTPLDGPNSGWTINALAHASEKYGAPKHMIMDHDPVFPGSAFSEQLENRESKPSLILDILPFICYFSIGKV